MIERIEDLPEPLLPIKSTFLFFLRASMVGVLVVVELGCPARAGANWMALKSGSGSAARCRKNDRGGVYRDEWAICIAGAKSRNWRSEVGDKRNDAANVP